MSVKVKDKDKELPIKPKPKLKPDLYWKWRYFISDWDRAKVLLDLKKTEQVSLAQESQIQGLKYQLKAHEVNAREAELKLAEKNYFEIKAELEKQIGMKLDNHAIKESGEIEPLEEG